MACQGSSGAESRAGLITGVQSTDFSRPLIEQERAQLKLVLSTPLWLEHWGRQHARDELVQTGVGVLVSKLVERGQLFHPFSLTGLILRISSCKSDGARVGVDNSIYDSVIPSSAALPSGDSGWFAKRLL